MNVKPKKHLGQHFLTNMEICDKIAEAIHFHEEYTNLIEIGPGTGALTNKIIPMKGVDFAVVEIDKESIEYLNIHHPNLKVIDFDFLKLDLVSLFNGEQLGIIGNFPYNISSQILFKIFDNYQLIPEMVGMFQKEVAERVCEKPGSKTYGILSVLIQSLYEAEYLFTVDENSFNPPPKVKSGVIRLKRKDIKNIDFDLLQLKKIVKLAFNQRRKTLRNSLKSEIQKDKEYSIDLGLRPEQLSYEDFIQLISEL